ncbi:hypothetical protein BO86DRAFT_95754 [Aspergillus japonicus CBS 114.51]|uniref:Uncharacterized protein n=1 Tax=Aspergillus japonicus CBS 114.51 TaxID=1448312 RepID=A0A8T8X1Y3_ASPJA|nr:hypothetical protein BO86DRAFT_95754 [Aspergillus japonicus CBS 114.51]RAH81642.1 hypothetical protein BO86DRAFT_95754 [Aspergillus japonicus CBS 114.51]
MGVVQAEMETHRRYMRDAFAKGTASLLPFLTCKLKLSNPPLLCESLYVLTLSRATFRVPLGSVLCFIGLLVIPLLVGLLVILGIDFGTQHGCTGSIKIVKEASGETLILSHFRDEKVGRSNGEEGPRRLINIETVGSEGVE